QVGTYVYTARPTPRLLVDDLLQERVGWALAAGLLLMTLLRTRRKMPRPIVWAWAVVCVAWPLALFLMDHFTGSSFYMRRYFALSAVCFSLLAAGLLHAWRPWARQMIMLLVVIVHFAPGNLTRRPRIGDISLLAAWMEHPESGGGAPWIVNSLFVEGRIA